MIEREKLLEIAGSKQAREIYRFVKENKGMVYNNELIRKLEFPSATVNRYLSLMEKAKIIKRNLKKNDSQDWVRAINIPQTDEAKTFDSLIYGT